MSNTHRPSGGKVLGGYILFMVGRVCFAVVSAYALTYLLFGWPGDGRRILIGFAAAALLMLAAAYLSQDFRWVSQLPFFGLAVGTLLVGAAMGRLYFEREPHSLSGYEAGVAVGCISVFLACVLWLRRQK